MSLSATMLITYVWHYVVARLIYDDLIRPLVPIAIGCAIVVAILIVRRRRAN